MIKKEEILKNIDFYINEMKLWKIFIYPTDTLIWFWCNVRNNESIAKIYEIKKRQNKPLLIIAPSIQRIEENCEISEENLEKIKQKLPWPYSFIVKLKDKSVISPLVNNNQDNVWIRIPNSWFTELVNKSWVPFITTSVNFSWENPAIKISNIPKEILDKVDYIIDDDENLSWKSSTLIDLTWEEEVVLRK